MMRSNSAEKTHSQTSILDVIGQHVTLRQRGREFCGLCPFHEERTPSFSVNPEKNLFYCHGCHVGGNAITFIQKIEGVDFKTAAKKLGAEDYRPSPDQLRIRREARNIAVWARDTSNKLCDALCEIGDEIRVCKLAREQSGITPEIAEHEAALIRQWAILADLDDDLNNPKLAVELWHQRKDIECLVESIA